MDPAFAVHVINARKKSGSKKKATRKNSKPAKKAAKPRSKSMAKKKAKKKNKRAPAKPGTATTRAIARRKPNAPAKKKGRKKGRKKNPSASVSAMMSEMKSAIPRILGMMATAWAVRRFSGHNGLFGTPHTSPMLGDSWGWKQYAIAGAVATWVPALAGKLRINATEFRRGAVDLITLKLIWTEGFARSPWAVNAFGTGDVGYNPANQQAYVQQGQRWDAMQGLVESSPLDGLVESSPLDAAPDYSYGHLLPGGVPASVAASGKYTGTGFTSKYHAAYAR